MARKIAFSAAELKVLKHPEKPTSHITDAQWSFVQLGWGVVRNEHANEWFLVLNERGLAERAKYI